MPACIVTAGVDEMTSSSAMPIGSVDGEPPPPSQDSHDSHGSHGSHGSHDSRDSHDSHDSQDTSLSSHQILFKKHKVLPHPRKDASVYASLRGSRPLAALRRQDPASNPIDGALSDDISVASFHPSSPRVLKHYPKKLGSGPDLPPTPPAHSRNSSSTYSAVPSNAASAQSPDRSAEDVLIKPPALPITPTKQMSPPTPDVTPPYVAELNSRPRAVPQPRPPAREREPSKGTADSRTASFKTARENPSSGDEEEEEGYATLRPILPSTKTSASTVRRVQVASSSSNDDAERNDSITASTTDTAIKNDLAKKPQPQPQPQPLPQPQPQPVGLGLGLESSPSQSAGMSSTPTSKRDFVSFDGEWGSSSGAEDVVQEWDDNLARNVVVRKRRAPLRNPSAHSRHVVVDDLTVSPTNATQAVRSMSLPHRILTFPSPIDSPEQPPQQQPRQLSQPPPPQHLPAQQPPLLPLDSAAPITTQIAPVSESSESDKDRRRVSTMSSKSTVSTVIEAFLVNTTPQRRPTLRHMKKQIALRDSVSDLSPTSSAPTSIALDDGTKLPQHRVLPSGGRPSANAHDSMLSTATTTNSVSSRSARREVWKAGGIPVVIVPDRRSSVRSSSREPSLRSTSSRRSKKSQKSQRSQSVQSVPLSQFSTGRDRPPNAGSPNRRGRTVSESDGSAPGDQRTIDYPPVVPKRTSSLSAPTSRNASRSGSLTAESLKAHTDLLQAKLEEQEQEQKTREVQEALQTVQAQEPVPEVQEVQEQRDVPRVLPHRLPHRLPRKPLPELSRELGSQRDAHQEKSQKQAPETRQAASVPTYDLVQAHARPRQTEEARDVATKSGGRETFPEVKVDEANEPTIPTTPKNHRVGFDHGHGHHDFLQPDYHDHLDPQASFDRHNSDLALGKHLSPQNTPFSLASVDTTTTHHSHAEVSEALAVNIYPHQNTSVLVVDHSNRPSDGSDESQPDRLTDLTERSASTQEYTLAPIIPSATSTRSQITPLEYDGILEDGPVTPPHPLFSLEDVDSPLRNPRAPPEPPVVHFTPEPRSGPPAINFIPATPLGQTPTPTAQQRQRRLSVGEPPEEMPEVDDSSPPRRSVSLALKRALTRGRRSEYGPSASRTAGLVNRTRSLTDRVRRRSASFRRSDSADESKGSATDAELADEDRLHPFWRPFSSRTMDEEGDDAYQYPPFDERPAPRRSFSARMKRTFAILPLDDSSDDFYPASRNNGPERRTVRRTPSGNLRVMKHRSSLDSVGQGTIQDPPRPYTAPERHSRRVRFWKAPSFAKDRTAPSHELEPSEMSGAADSDKRHRFKALPGIGGKIGEFGLQSIPRRLSERRREKRSNELRQKISAPQEVRDGVGDVIRHTHYRDAFTHAPPSSQRVV